MRAQLARIFIMTLAITSSYVAASERLDDGQAAYKQHCGECHDSGEQGAPVTNNPQDWVNRSRLWDAVLLEHAEKGYLKMPAKGGAENASEYDVKAAAEYMVTVTHPDMPHD